MFFIIFRLGGEREKKLMVILSIYDFFVLDDVINIDIS